MLAAMGTTLLVIAIGLTFYAGTADRERRVGELRDSMTASSVDVPAGGGPWRIAAAGSGLSGVVLLVGAVAAPASRPGSSSREGRAESPPQ